MRNAGAGAWTLRPASIRFSQPFPSAGAYGAMADIVPLREARRDPPKFSRRLGHETAHLQSFNVTRSRPASSITSVFFSSERLS